MTEPPRLILASYRERLRLMPVTPPLLTPERTSHPFLTYEMILEIPKGFRATMGVMEREATYPLPAPVMFTGCGTAFFSARMGSQLLGTAGVRWKAAPAFEVDHYERLDGGTVVGVSHSGITKATVDSLARAKKERLFTVGLTHFAGRPIAEAAEKVHVVGGSPDASRCHTKTYTSSAAAVMALALRHSELEGGALEGISDELRRLAGDLDRVVSGSETSAREAAESLSGVKKVYLAGAGPNQVTAQEVALKFKETSYIGAEGFELEEILHGPWASVDEDTLVVAISSGRSSAEKTRTLLRASRGLGAKTMVVADSEFEADYSFQIPPAHEYLIPFLAVIPLYFVSYFVAVNKGHNPDYLRYLEQRYWEARQIIFPPGTH